MVADEKRNFTRMPINTPATLTSIEPVAGLNYTAMCLDISATGISLQLDELLEPNSILSIAITSTHPRTASLQAIAKVIRASKESDGTITAGLEIIQFN